MQPDLDPQFIDVNVTNEAINIKSEVQGNETNDSIHESLNEDGLVHDSLVSNC